MDTKLPRPVHLSYQRHRKQLVWQIVFPIVLTSLLLIALVVLINIATFRDNGEVGRWAAVSTMWIAIPVMIAGVIAIIILGGLVFLLAKLLGITPTYTGQAQDFVHRIAGYAKRGADAVVRPVIDLEGFIASVNAFLGRK